MQLGIVGDPSLAETLGEVCEARSLEPSGLSLRTVRDLHLCLVVWPPADEGHRDLFLPALERLGRVRDLLLLWHRAAWLEPPAIELARRCAWVFAADGMHLRGLREAGIPEPLPLQPCTRLPARAPDMANRSIPVAWIVTGSSPWPSRGREWVTTLLDAADRHGLTIGAVPGADISSLSETHRSRVRRLDNDGVAAVLSDAQVVVGADPTSASDMILPAGVLEGLAQGAAVISPHLRGVWDALHDIVPIATTREQADAHLDHLLGDPDARRAMVTRSRAVIANNHTPEHRVATLASARGWSLVPRTSSCSSTSS